MQNLALLINDSKLTTCAKPGIDAQNSPGHEAIVDPRSLLVRGRQRRLQQEAPKVRGKVSDRSLFSIL